MPDGTTSCKQDNDLSKSASGVSLLFSLPPHPQHFGRHTHGARNATSNGDPVELGKYLVIG